MDWDVTKRDDSEQAARPAGPGLSLPLDLPVSCQNGGLFISRGQGTHPARKISSYELIYVRHGVLEIEEAGVPYSVGPGQSLLLSPDTPHAGTAPYSTVLVLQSQLSANEAAVPQLEQRLTQSEDLLATLAGHFPADWSVPQVSLADLSLPAELPVSLPSELVRRRPDILAAEATAHAASANVGVATAAMLPEITLSAGMGSSANSFEQLFAAGTGVWNYGAGITQPVFQGGSLINRRKAAQASYRAALADYRQSVLQAFAQVADTLSAIDHDSEAHAAQSRADAAAQTALQLVRANHTAGLAGDGDLLASEAQADQARAALLAAQAARLQDEVALYAALGGGWWP